MITALGWLGTALVALSYAQPDEARLRRISLLASVALISFNLALGIWSNVALEVALVVINTARLRLADKDEPLATAAGEGTQDGPAGALRSASLVG